MACPLSENSPERAPDPLTAVASSQSEFETLAGDRYVGARCYAKGVPGRRHECAAPRCAALPESGLSASTSAGIFSARLASETCVCRTLLKREAFAALSRNSDDLGKQTTPGHSRLGGNRGLRGGVIVPVAYQARSWRVIW